MLKRAGTTVLVVLAVGLGWTGVAGAAPTGAAAVAAGGDGSDRAAVVEQLLGTKDREGVFGKYSFDSNGDITLTPYGVYKIEDGALAFDRTVEPGS